MNFRPSGELYRQLSFISYYFHWPLEQTLDLPHLERERFCREISRINRRANEGEEKNIFTV